MSTILKALRRLEREKSAGVDRPLSESVASPLIPSPPERSARSRRPLVLVSLAVLVSAGTAAFFLLPRDEPSGTAERVTAAAVEKPPAARVRRPSPRTAAESRGAEAPAPRTATAAKRLATAVVEPDDPREFRELSPAALASNVEVVERVPIAPTAEEIRAAVEAIADESMAKLPALPPGVNAETPPAAAEKPAPTARAVTRPEPGSQRPGSARAEPITEATAAAAPKPGSRRPGSKPPTEEEAQIASAPPTKPAPGTRRPGAQPPSDPPQQLARTAAPRVSPTPPPKPPPAVVASVDKPAAPPPRPPQRLRSPLPNVVVERTIWHPLAERRVAVVELPDRGESLELREGDAVGPLVVKEIGPSGVTFVNEGVELRRRVGER